MRHTHQILSCISDLLFFPGLGRFSEHITVAHCLKPGQVTKSLILRKKCDNLYTFRDFGDLNLSRRQCFVLCCGIYFLMTLHNYPCAVNCASLKNNLRTNKTREGGLKRANPLALTHRVGPGHKIWKIYLFPGDGATTFVQRCTVDGDNYVPGQLDGGVCPRSILRSKKLPECAFVINCCAIPSESLRR